MDGKSPGAYQGHRSVFPVKGAYHMPDARKVTGRNRNGDHTRNESRVRGKAIHKDSLRRYGDTDGALNLTASSGYHRHRDEDLCVDLNGQATTPRLYRAL